MSGGGTAIKGFRFGMLLQLAVGPVCLFVLRAASTQGFWAGTAAGAAVAVIDAVYIALAILGVAAALGRPAVKRWLGLFGAAVLVLFGVSTLLGAFGVTVLPGLRLGGEGLPPFWGALLLTASNPLTILFWAGVFSGKVAELGMCRREVWLFGAGALASTAISMTVVSMLGSLIGTLLPQLMVLVLNGLVGAALMGFGIRMGWAQAGGRVQAAKRKARG